MRSRGGRTVYVGGLPTDISLREVQNLFYEYGHIVDIDLKTPPRSPAYAFIEFEDAHFANIAIGYRDGFKFYGKRLRVELAHGKRGYASSIDRNGGYSRGSCHSAGSRHSDYRVLVTGLPISASLQDLMDHMRYAGDVCFYKIFRDINDTIGIVDYTNYTDMRYAVRVLDHSEFSHSFSQRYYIRVREYCTERPPYNSRRSPSRPRRGHRRSGSPYGPRIRYRHGWTPSPFSDYRLSRTPNWISHPSPQRSLNNSMQDWIGHIRSRSNSRSRSRSRSRSSSSVLPIFDAQSASQSPEVIFEELSPVNSSESSLKLRSK